MIRSEVPNDIVAIRQLTTDAFRNAEHSSQTEAAIVDALREAGAMMLSLVAVDGGELVGHVAFSSVTVNGRNVGWYGLGPVSVRPARQGQGIGGSLIRAGMEKLRALGAEGCVVLGDPNYYGRFGFRRSPLLLLENVPPEYFQIFAFGPKILPGVVTYHDAFEAS
jgi:putative acetyltransferase